MHEKSDCPHLDGIWTLEAQFTDAKVLNCQGTEPCREAFTVC